MNTSLPYAARAAGTSPRAGFWRCAIDRNPFYLLSAVCMLTGCILLSNSTSWSPIPVQRILTLIFTLNVYEAALIAIAVWLLRRPDPGQNRDGAILIGIEAFFLVDLTWLNAEMFAIDLKLGTMVNSILLILAFCKLAAIYRGLGRELTSGPFVFAMTLVVMLSTLPGVFKWIAESQPPIRRGTLPAAAIYGAWWMVGLIPILAIVFLRPASTVRGFLSRLHYRRVVNVLAIFAFASLVLHLSLFNWVYKVRWYNANVAPLVLGLAVAVGSYDRHVVSLATRMRLQLLLPIGAMMLSGRYNSALVFDGWVTITPLRLTFAGATLVYLHGLWLHRHAWFAIATATCFGAVGLGASFEMIRQTMQTGWGLLAEVMRRMTPRTSTHWGFVSVVAAFVLLALGAVASVVKGRRTAPEIMSPTNGEEKLMV